MESPPPSKSLLLRSPCRLLRFVNDSPGSSRLHALEWRRFPRGFRHSTRRCPTVVCRAGGSRKWWELEGAAVRRWYERSWPARSARGGGWPTSMGRARWRRAIGRRGARPGGCGSFGRLRRHEVRGVSMCCCGVVRSGWSCSMAVHRSRGRWRCGSRDWRASTMPPWWLSVRAEGVAGIPAGSARS